MNQTPEESTAISDALFEAIQPYADAAAASQRVVPEDVTVELNAGAEMTVDVVHMTADGQSRTWRGLVTGSSGEAVAAALAAFVEAGLNRLPLEQRHKVAGLLEHGAELSAVCDPLFRSAVGRLTVAGHAPVDLFGLRSGNVH